MGRFEPDTEQLHPLADLDRIIHSPARLMVMTYLYVVESADFVFLMQLTGLRGAICPPIYLNWRKRVMWRWRRATKAKNRIRRSV